LACAGVATGPKLDATRATMVMHTHNLHATMRLILDQSARFANRANARQLS